MLLWLMQALPWVHTAEDSVRVVTLLQGALAHVVPAWFPVALVLPILGGVTWWGFHYAEIWVKKVPALQPIVVAWENHTSWVNPVLVYLMGWGVTALSGIHASGLWGLIVAALAAGMRSFAGNPGSSSAAVAKAKAAVVMGLMVPWLLLAFHSDSLAATKATGNPLIDQASGVTVPTQQAPTSVWSFSPGLGYRGVGGIGKAQYHPAGDILLGYARPKLRLKATLQFGKEIGYGQRGEVFSYVRIAPYF